jgi:hypothetical protein
VNKSNRTVLREELSKRFIPYLWSIGFERAKDSAKADGRSAFPFGTLIRMHGTASDIIEIQFDKYSKPKFIINFRKDPPRIVKGGHLRSVPDRVRLVEHFRLHPRPKSPSWFTMRTFLGLPEICAQNVVDRLMNLFPEVESWFKDGTMEEHVRMIPVPLLQDKRDHGAS